MSITHTSNAEFQVSTDTLRSQTKSVEFEFVGMRPNATYSISIDGIDYGWATRPEGKDLGDPIVANARGFVKIFILMEIPYEGVIAYDNLNPVSSQNSLIGEQIDPKRRQNYIVSKKLIELKSGDSYVRTYKNLRLLINPYHINRIEHHGH